MSAFPQKKFHRYQSCVLHSSLPAHYLRSSIWRHSRPPVSKWYALRTSLHLSTYGWWGTSATVNSALILCTCNFQFFGDIPCFSWSGFCCCPLCWFSSVVLYVFMSSHLGCCGHPPARVMYVLVLSLCCRLLHFRLERSCNDFVMRRRIFLNMVLFIQNSVQSCPATVTYPQNFVIVHMNCMRSATLW